MSVLKWRNGNTWKNIVDLIFPIGTMFLSQANTSPAGFVGGTWAEFNENRFLLPNKNTATGGSWSITVNNLPAHNHSTSNSAYRFLTQQDAASWEWLATSSSSSGSSWEVRYKAPTLNGSSVIHTEDNTANTGGCKIMLRLIDSVIVGVGLLKNQVIAYG